jgi:NTP pyrophosphatase (non-canonical NTP hydrolase)
LNKDQEILLITQEECAEVIVAVSKCFRFGLDHIKPTKEKTNREHLTEELGDLLAMIRICQQYNIVDSASVENAANEKIAKLKRWSNIFN